MAAAYHDTYHELLGRLELLNSYLVIIDHPRISLPTHAVILIQKLKDDLPAISKFLTDDDFRIVQAYASDVHAFCRTFFDTTIIPSPPPAVLEINYPCDRTAFLQQYESLYQHYLTVRTKLRSALRKNWD